MFNLKLSFTIDCVNDTLLNKDVDNVISVIQVVKQYCNYDMFDLTYHIEISHDTFLIQHSYQNRHSKTLSLNVVHDSGVVF